jgi:hypothetical protein
MNCIVLVNLTLLYSLLHALLHRPDNTKKGIFSVRLYNINKLITGETSAKTAAVSDEAASSSRVLSSKRKRDEVENDDDDYEYDYEAVTEPFVSSAFGPSNASAVSNIPLTLLLHNT